MWSLIDDIFNRALPSVFSQNFNTGISLPMVNIKETSDAYFVEMAETIDDGKIEAKYNEGILSIYLPKKEEAKQKPARSIKIS